MRSDVLARIGFRSALTALIVCLAASAPVAAQDSSQDGAQAEIAVIDGLAWTSRTNGQTVSWDEASEYCETLEVAGLSDWRLPTIDELESVYDPDVDARIDPALSLDDCCAWSSTSLTELEAEQKGVLPGPLNELSGYFWGFLYSAGIRYYSLGRFPDGSALCVNDNVSD
jgi:hypothetical protein